MTKTNNHKTIFDAENNFARSQTRVNMAVWRAPALITALACLLGTAGFAAARNSNATQQTQQQTQANQQGQAVQQGQSDQQQQGGDSVVVKDKKKENAKEAKKEDSKKAAKVADLPAVLWTDRGDISQLDMISGQGGAKHFPDPKMEYTYAGEDLDGTATKFYAVDANGQKWLVKLGPEAQPETVATRFVWAMGYYTDEDYFEPEIHVKGMRKLKRNMYDADVKTGMVPNVRLKREFSGSKKIDTWDWFDNPFLGTQEFNGLRVLMALLNNWDLKEQNNKIYVVDDQRRYVVSDLGAAFGKSGAPIHDPIHLPIPHATKGDFDDYEKSKFIKDVTPNTVSFEMKTDAPFYMHPFKPAYFSEYGHMVKIEDGIPTSAAKWIGARLQQLTHQQVVMAFRAGGYIPEDAEAYATVVESRIAQLNELRDQGASVAQHPDKQK